MKRLAHYITGKEWAVFIAAVTALLTQLPALVELVEGELDREDWSPIGLLVLVMGFLIRSNVFRTATYDRDVAAAFDAGRSGVAVKANESAADGGGAVVANLRGPVDHGLNVQLPAEGEDDAAVTALLERARQGLPVPGVNAPGEQVAQPGEVA
jgi:hypothetical protein